MKKIVFLLLISVFIGCKARKTNASSTESKTSVTKLALTEVSSIQKNRSYELGKRVLMTCNTSTFKPFTSEEATAEVIQKINKDKISITCQNILRKFGQFQDIKLKEVFRLEEEGITVFRYQCVYEKKYSIKELRVAVNAENKVTSITTKDWKDEFKP